MDSIIKEVQDLDQAGSGTTVTFKLDKAAIANAVGRDSPYRSLPSKFIPALEQVADYVRITMIPRVFEKEGPGWAPLAMQTQIQRKAGGYGAQHPILQRDRDLYKELTDKAHPRHVEVIKVGKNARIEIGGSSEKFIQNQLGEGDPGQLLPSRPMIPGTGNIPLEDRDRQRIKEILANAIKGRK